MKYNVASACVLSLYSISISYQFVEAFSFSVTTRDVNFSPFLSSRRRHVSHKSSHSSNIVCLKMIESDDDDVNSNSNWWQEEGEDLIRVAATNAGADPSLLEVNWSVGRVEVIVGGDAFVETDDEDDDDDYEVQEGDDEIEMSESSETEESEKSNRRKGPDIVSIARAINAALDGEEGSVGWNVATFHEVDVTTPGVKDELVGLDQELLNVYRGFDVIVEAFDKKNGKNIVYEGKLVERDEDVTRINLKGRVKKLKNELVSSIKLPKAKKEKGMK